MKTLLLTLAAMPLSLLSPCLAEDLVPTAGKTYTNITISRAEPDGLVIMTDSGIEKLPFAILPADLQAKYGYDPAKAGEFSAAVRGAAAQRQAAINAAETAKTRATYLEFRAKDGRELTARIEKITATGVVAQPIQAAYAGPRSFLARVGDGGGGGGRIERFDAGEPIFVEGLKNAEIGATQGFFAFHEGHVQVGGKKYERWIAVPPPNK